MTQAHPDTGASHPPGDTGTSQGNRRHDPDQPTQGNHPQEHHHPDDRIQPGQEDLRSFVQDLRRSHLDQDQALNMVSAGLPQGSASGCRNCCARTGCTPPGPARPWTSWRPA